MTICPGCYKRSTGGYCLNCRKELFDGVMVSPVLSFDAGAAADFYRRREQPPAGKGPQEKPKYFLQLEGKQLRLSGGDGRYILQPASPSALVSEAGQEPANEHLTMQIARQVFGIDTVANALIYFKDGEPAYIARRSGPASNDIRRPHGETGQAGGSNPELPENIRYPDTYEDFGQFIRRHVAAYPPHLEQYFRLVLFNYLFSNEDACLQDFSLIQSDMGDYIPAPACDLKCSVLHRTGKGDMAPALYRGDTENKFYQANGFWGQPHFRAFAEKIGIRPIRTGRVLTALLTHRAEVVGMVQRSFLSDKMKERYLNAYWEKLRRMGMTKEMIIKSIRPVYPGIYAPTTTPVRLSFRDGSAKTGFFYANADSVRLGKQNKYTFVENSSAINYREANDDRFVTIVDGDQLVQAECFFRD